MRIFRHHPVRLARAFIVTSLFVAAGCGGGSNSTLPNSGNGQLCDSNAGSISIARPTFNFPANGNTIEIVSSSSTDDLHGNPGAFDLLLNNSIATSTLSPLPDTTGPHPYTTDFYYQANLPPGLPSGTYSVYLNAPNSACTQGFIGTVSI